MRQPLDESALDTLFRTARTYNGYRDEPVTEDQIHRIYELLKMGPTSANQQPGRFVWCLNQDAKDRLADCASGNNAPKIRAAPATVIIGMDGEFHEELPWLFPHDDARSWFAGDDKVQARHEQAFRNSSLQAAYFIFAARAIGLGTGPMTGFDAEKIEAAFFADRPSVKVNMISTLGVGDPASIFPRLPRPDFDKFNTIA